MTNKHAAFMADGSTLANRVYVAVKHHMNVAGPNPQNLYETVLKEVMPAILSEVLIQNRGNQTATAEMLGLQRSTLSKKIKEYRPR